MCGDTTAATTTTTTTTDLSESVSIFSRLIDLLYLNCALFGKEKAGCMSAPKWYEAALVVTCTFSSLVRAPASASACFLFSPMKGHRGNQRAAQRRRHVDRRGERQAAGDHGFEHSPGARLQCSRRHPPSGRKDEGFNCPCIQHSIEAAVALPHASFITVFSSSFPRNAV